MPTMIERHGGRARSPWMRGAAYAFDFTKQGRGIFAGAPFSEITALPGWSFSRASFGYSRNKAGLLIPFSSGQLRMTDQGLLVEGSRTNLLIRSQELDNATWTMSEASVVADAIAAPDGTLTADQLKESSNTTEHGYIDAGASFTNGTIYTLSLFAKPNGRNLRLLLPAAAFGSNQIARYDLSAGTATSIGGSPTVGIEALANGWYRCWLFATASTTASASCQVRVLSGTTASYAGDGASGAYLWGAQLEAAAGASSYIPTTSATATRAADRALINGVSIAYPLTLFAEVEPAPYVTTSVWLSADSGDAAERVQIATSNDVRSNMLAGGVAQGPSTLAILPASGVVLREASRFGANDIRVAANGSLGGQDSSATAAATATSILLGDLRGGTSPTFMYLRRASAYPRALSDAELQALTA